MNKALSLHIKWITMAVIETSWRHKMTVPQKIMNRAQVIEAVSLSYTQIWRLEKAGTFPCRVKLGPSRVGWLASEIADWIDARAEERCSG